MFPTQLWSNWMCSARTHSEQKPFRLNLTSYTNIISERATDFSAMCKTIKLVKKINNRNTDEHLYNLGLGDAFRHLTPKSQSIKGSHQNETLSVCKRARGGDETASRAGRK